LKKGDLIKIILSQQRRKNSLKNLNGMDIFYPH